MRRNKFRLIHRETEVLFDRKQKSYHRAVSLMLIVDMVILAMIIKPYGMGSLLAPTYILVMPLHRRESLVIHILISLKKMVVHPKMSLLGLNTFDNFHPVSNLFFLASPG